MFNSWIFFAIVSVITLSVASILGRILLKDEKSDPLGYSIVFQFLLGAVTLVFAVLFHKFKLPAVSAPLFYFLAAGFLWAGTTYFGFKCLKRLNAGEATILTSSGAFVTIILSIIFLGEKLKLMSIIGTFLILLAVFVINSEKLNFKSREGMVYGILSSVCAAIAVIFDTTILKNYESFSYTIIMSFLPGIILIALFPIRTLKIPKMFGFKTLGLMTVMSAVYSVQAVTFYLALEHGAPISSLSPFSKSSIVLTVILGAVFLNERSHLLKKFAAAILVTLGAVLVS
jgi:drug/metabolite transporter (DMT)-like permease